MNKITAQKMTVKEALENGYTSFFYNSDGWQRLRSLSDIVKGGEEVDWSRDDIYIVEKEPTQSLSISYGEIKELIIDHLCCKYYDLTHNDDDNVISDALINVDFSGIEKEISNALEGVTSYHSTEIKLTT